MATPTQNTEEGWTLVTRRRRPPHFLPSPQPIPTTTVALNSRPLTYAQALRSTPASPTRPNNQMASQDTGLRHVRSPQSPTNLRYPPSPHYKEWWGRCFRCAQKGHVVAECKVPRMPKEGTTTVQTIPPVDLPARPEPQQKTLLQKRTRQEPSFEEFLTQPEPTEEPFMPQTRPSKAVCYFNRDDHYYQTLDKAMTGIVIIPPECQREKMTLDRAADIIATSQRIKPMQMQVARLTQDRFLVVLPPDVNRDEVAADLPKNLWDEGYRFYPYSPIIDASVSIPFFKIWVDIKGVPVELHTEAHMARAVSSFGTYLGSMEARTVGDCQTWSVFLATDDLNLIPHQIEIRVGGMVYVAHVHPRKWTKG